MPGNQECMTLLEFLVYLNEYSFVAEDYQLMSTSERRRFLKDKSVCREAIKALLTMTEEQALTFTARSELERLLEVRGVELNPEWIIFREDS